MSRTLPSVKFLFSNIVTNATDDDGDQITITSASVSTNNVTVLMNPFLFLYSNTNRVNDRFTYTLTDGFGGSASGTITINYDPFVAG